VALDPACLLEGLGQQDRSSGESRFPSVVDHLLVALLRFAGERKRSIGWASCPVAASAVDEGCPTHE
jgi:hypothetical protein